MEIRNKNITVLGLGISGTAAAAFLIKNGANVFISENKSFSEMHRQLEFLHKQGNFAIETGGHTNNCFLDKDIIVVSPGILPSIPVLMTARGNGMKIISEVELAFSFLPASHIIALTGTNGKTTTVHLIRAILRQAGFTTVLSGNVGKPLIDFAGVKRDFYIVELSSFQLMSIDKFRPHIACLINIAEDHFDYHDNSDAYVTAKLNIFKNQKADDYALLNGDDKNILSSNVRTRGRKIYYGMNRSQTNSFYFEDGSIFDVTGREIIKTNELKIVGKHNISNIICALEVGRLCGAAAGASREAIKNFKPLAHRIEPVKKWHNATIINDSKSTNIHSLNAALRSITSPVVLICGGKDKGLDYSGLRSIIKEKVKSIYLIGEIKGKMGFELGHKRTFQMNNLKAAVKGALSDLVSGDTLLFSPGTSSYDMFSNYKERGEKFKKYIMEFTKEGL